MTVFHDDDAPEAAYVACDACGAEERVGTGPLPDGWCVRGPLPLRVSGPLPDLLDLCPWCAAFNDPDGEHIP